MIYAIVGPTASGKTDLAVKLAKYFNAPIINCDAFQIYKDMNIGTGKLAEESDEYKMHYLLDIVTPDMVYSVKQYQEDFRKLLKEFENKYENIIVCGGTGLYLKAALYDYTFEDEEPQDVSDLENLSNDELYEMLQNIDPKSCESIHKNNRKRVIRALQIARSHDEIKSASIDKQQHEMIIKNVKVYSINLDREILYERINKRVQKMFDSGLVDEVKKLLKNYELSQTAKAAIGYKEVIDYLDGKLSLEDAIALVQQRSRNYAKRQMTFFRHQLPVEFKNSAEEIYEEIING